MSGSGSRSGISKFLVMLSPVVAKLLSAPGLTRLMIVDRPPAIHSSLRVESNATSSGSELPNGEVLNDVREPSSPVPN